MQLLTIQCTLGDSLHLPCLFIYAIYDTKGSAFESIFSVSTLSSYLIILIFSLLARTKWVVICSESLSGGLFSHHLNYLLSLMLNSSFLWYYSWIVTLFVKLSSLRTKKTSLLKLFNCESFHRLAIHHSSAPTIDTRTEAAIYCLILQLFAL